MILYPAIDLKDGKCVRLFQGDMKKATVSALEPAEQAEKLEKAGHNWLHMVDLNGVSAIIYTDIARDGAMQGPNIEETVKLALSITTPVIASGGISSIEDIKRYKEVETSGIEGVVIGRALYEGKIRAEEAIKL